jgi:hypothetical protein
MDRNLLSSKLKIETLEASLVCEISPKFQPTVIPDSHYIQQDQKKMTSGLLAIVTFNNPRRTHIPMGLPICAILPMSEN